MVFNHGCFHDAVLKALNNSQRGMRVHKFSFKMFSTEIFEICKIEKLAIYTCSLLY